MRMHRSVNSQFTLVVLPGWGGDKTSWADFVSQMQKKGIHTEVLELPCFGGVSCPKTVWGVNDYAQYVVSRLDEIPGDLVLLGHSFGGQVAVKVMAEGHDRVIKLILSGPAIIRPRRIARRVFFFVVAKIGKGIFALPLLKKFAGTAKKVLYRGADSPDYAQTDDIKREIFKRVIRQDLTHDLSKIMVHTLVIAGEKDTYVPMRYSTRVAKGIDGAKLAVIKNGKHGLHKQKVEEFVASIINFLTPQP